MLSASRSSFAWVDTHCPRIVFITAPVGCRATAHTVNTTFADAFFQSVFVAAAALQSAGRGESNHDLQQKGLHAPIQYRGVPQYSHNWSWNRPELDFEPISWAKQLLTISHFHLLRISIDNHDNPFHINMILRTKDVAKECWKLYITWTWISWHTKKIQPFNGSKVSFSQVISLMPSVDHRSTDALVVTNCYTGKPTASCYLSEEHPTKRPPGSCWPVHDSVPTFASLKKTAKMIYNMILPFFFRCCHGLVINLTWSSYGSAGLSNN